MNRKPLVLITGASQGIGEAVACVFATELRGCRLALASRNERKLSAVARRCLKLGAGAAEVFRCDVSDGDAVERMAAEMQWRMGVPDVLVNNAGVFREAAFEKTSVEEFDMVLATNLRSVFLVSRAFVPAMAKRRSGHVFNMSSIAGLGAYPRGAAYCAAKFGVTGLTKVMREELRKKGVRVTAVHPGATATPSWKGSGVAPSRMMPAEDIARAIVDAYRLSARTVVEEIVLRPQLGDI